MEGKCGDYPWLELSGSNGLCEDKLNLVEAHTDLILYGKSKEDLDNPSLKLGLLSYPVLQAADILVHR